MTITRENIREWLEDGAEEGATHVIVICDTFSYEEYPVFVSSSEKVSDKVNSYRSKDMQTVMEVYNLSMDWDEQLKRERCFEY